MAILADSGERKEFDTGAMREIVQGKGRCDLLPLDVVADVISPTGYTSSVIANIDDYIRIGKIDSLYRAIRAFVNDAYPNMPTAILEVAQHYEDGANKYAERNWEKGLPLHSFIDSGVRHYLKWLRGDKDEPHERAFIWNMLGAIWTHKHKPELIDLPFKKEENK